MGDFVKNCDSGIDSCSITPSYHRYVTTSLEERSNTSGIFTCTPTPTSNLAPVTRSPKQPRNYKWPSVALVFGAPWFGIPALVAALRAEAAGRRGDARGAWHHSNVSFRFNMLGSLSMALCLLSVLCYSMTCGQFRRHYDIEFGRRTTTDATVLGSHSVAELKEELLWKKSARRVLPTGPSSSDAGAAFKRALGLDIHEEILPELKRQARRPPGVKAPESFDRLPVASAQEDSAPLGLSGHPPLQKDPLV